MIYVEQAKILSQTPFAAEQFIVRLHAPQCARHAEPGTFVHLRCDDLLPMRRPFSIMRTDPEAGWIDILYRVFGEGTRLLSRRRAGEHLSLLGPIGKPFV
ncbi:MAG TPA: dihydroorotate dehydrogenase electron transfer subunit, partial [Gammaproteobacteria bacterium]|nr:dihydroorotate dehydrogenase electron transfer subunit [Gammaproteobacteria bacterium]